MTKNNQRFKLSDLVDRERYFYLTVVALVGIIIVLVAIFLENWGGASPIAEELTQQPENEATLEGDSAVGTAVSTADPIPAATATDPIPNPFWQAILTSDDLNAILDIWSENTTDIQVHPQVEFNLSDAAGRLFVARSKDIELTLEAYHFSGDPAMALKVSNALRKIYLEELGYANTELVCSTGSAESSWIIEDQNSHRLLLGRIAGANYVSVQIFSEAPFDKTDAAQLACTVADKQFEALRRSGFLPSSEIQ